MDTVRVKCLLPFVGLLNHPKVAGSSGCVCYGNCIESPAGTVPFDAELCVARWYDA